jgi:peptidoglycan/xylan/chitin deacetylase (PgdA/CDA1 family)
MRYIKIIYWTGVKLFSNLYFFLFRPHKKALTIFLYHEISDQPTEFGLTYNLTVSRKTFKKQVNWINNHFTVIHPNDLLNNKPLPDYPALITFDDGFLGAFVNGISYLASQKIPSLMFLNMDCIRNRKPILSSIACYLSDHSAEFEIFAEKVSLLKPYHLTLTPALYELFIEESGGVDLNKVLEYQGMLADESVIRSYNNNEYIAYGNHLFDHWNAAALSEDEFAEQYLKNKEELSKLNNSINMFAFPNGQPYTCFTEKNVQVLKSMGEERIFYSSGGANEDHNIFLLNRTALTELENSKRKFWIRILYSLFMRNNPFNEN